jgi:hypothetical protein
MKQSNDILGTILRVIAFALVSTAFLILTCYVHDNSWTYTWN